MRVKSILSIASRDSIGSAVPESNTEEPPLSASSGHKRSSFVLSGLIWVACLFNTFVTLIIIFSDYHSLTISQLRILVRSQLLSYSLLLVFLWTSHGSIVPTTEYIIRRVGTVLPRQFGANMLLYLRIKLQYPTGNEQIEWQCVRTTHSSIASRANHVVEMWG
jgi:hypothetical protein